VGNSSIGLHLPRHNSLTISKILGMFMEGILWPNALVLQVSRV